MIESVDTSGRAVLFAGMIVCIAMLGMFALGVSFLYGVAVAACDRGRVHGDRRADAAAGAARVLRRRACCAGASAARSRGQAADQRRVAGLGALGRAASAAPGAVRRGRRRRDGAASRSRSSRCAWAPPTRAPIRPARPRARPTTCSPRASGPATTARCSSSRRSSGPAQRPRSSAWRTRSPRTPGRRRRDAAAVHPEPRAGATGVALANVYPKGSPQDASTSNLLHTVRDRVVPAAERRHRPARPGRRPDRDLRRLRHRAVAQAAAVHRRRRRCSASCC